MSLQMKGLGRGLEALIPTDKNSDGSKESRRLPLAQLLVNPEQPRRHFAESALNDLADSIRNQGLLQPIIVRPLPGTAPTQYEIVAGERRYRACKIAGLTEVPVIVRELSDQDALVIALIENLQREDLNPLEEAQGLLQLKEQFSLSQDDLAQKLGKSRSAIANTLRLLNLAPAVRQDLADGKLFAGHGRALLAISSLEEQELIRKRIISENLSVRETEGLVAQWKEQFKAQEMPLDPPDSLEQAENTPTNSFEEDADLKPAKRKLPQSAVLMNWQDKVADIVKLPVKITGKEDKGKLSITYSSAEELQGILALLGLAKEAASGNEGAL